MVNRTYTQTIQLISSDYVCLYVCLFVCRSRGRSAPRHAHTDRSSRPYHGEQKQTTLLFSRHCARKDPAALTGSCLCGGERGINANVAGMRKSVQRSLPRPRGSRACCARSKKPVRTLVHERCQDCVSYLFYVCGCLLFVRAEAAEQRRALQLAPQLRHAAVDALAAAYSNASDATRSAQAEYVVSCIRVSP